jgi:hypothetical protein
MVAAIAELQMERQTRRDRLAALEAERDLTSSSPSKRQILGFKIRVVTQHLRDIDAVLDARSLAISNQTGLRT